MKGKLTFTSYIALKINFGQQYWQHLTNQFIESFNSRFRQECLNQHWFLYLNDAKEKVEKWRQEYNDFRPYSSLGNIPPAEFFEANRLGSH